MPELTGRCPMCEGELVVTHMRCQQCGTGLEGVFTLHKFDRLSREQLRFVDVFMKNRGVIRDVERELNISYPTVRSRLDEVIRALGYDSVATEAPSDGAARTATSSTGPEAAARRGFTPERRLEILEQVAAGGITAAEAAAQIRGGEEQ